MTTIDRRTILKASAGLGAGLGAAPLTAGLLAGSSRLAAADATSGAPAPEPSSPSAAASPTTPDAMQAPRHEFSLDFLYRRVSQLRAPVIVGPTPMGLRVNIHTEGGEFEGPRMKGRVLPGFGDALVIRKDGVGIIDSRTTMQTDDGATIFVHYMGVADFGEDAYERLLAGAPPGKTRLHTGPRFDTAHPKYAWLNRLQGVGIGQNDPAQGINLWDFYAIR